MARANPPPALRYMGLLGHEFAVLDADGRGKAEVNDLDSARRYARECSGTVWQYRGRKWLLVE